MLNIIRRKLGETDKFLLDLLTSNDVGTLLLWFLAALFSRCHGLARLGELQWISNPLIFAVFISWLEIIVLSGIGIDHRLVTPCSSSGSIVDWAFLCLKWCNNFRVSVVQQFFLKLSRKFLLNLSLLFKLFMKLWKLVILRKHLPIVLGWIQCRLISELERKRVSFGRLWLWIYSERLLPQHKLLKKILLLLEAKCSRRSEYVSWSSKWVGLSLMAYWSKKI